MGKFKHNSVEIVPIDDAPPITLFRNLPGAGNIGLRANMNKMPYISDPTLVPRVQKVGNSASAIPHSQLNVFFLPSIWKIMSIRPMLIST